MGQTRSPILLADIGGTNARFALLAGGGLGSIATYPVLEYPGPVEAIQAFVGQEVRGQRPTRAAIAAAGPLIDGRITLTNAPWTVEGDAIRRAIGLESVVLLNDFAALAWSIPDLAPGDLRTIGGGVSAEEAPIAVVGPGTGFGVSALLREHGAESVLVTEGGHATLASESIREDAIIQRLRERLGHVSIEAVLSGDGLVHLGQAIAAADGLAAPEHSAAEILERGLSGACVVSRCALESFCGFLGSVASDIALTLGARGGVYIGGGIVPRFVDFLACSSFRERFEGKGRSRPYLTAIPTAVIVHPHPTFLGLARFVQRRGHG